MIFFTLNFSFILLISYFSQLYKNIHMSYFTCVCDFHHSIPSVGVKHRSKLIYFPSCFMAKPYKKHSLV